MKRIKTCFDKNLEKFRKMIFSNRPMTLERFMEISRLQFDKDNFRYYLGAIPKSEGGDHYHGNRFYEVEGAVVWKAQQNKDLEGLLNAIVDHVEWVRPHFYNLGLHKEQLMKQKYGF